MEREKIKTIIKYIDPIFLKRFRDEINEEAFAEATNEYLKKIIPQVNENDITEKEYYNFVNTIMDTRFFQTAYTKAYNRLTMPKGKWIKFDQGSEPEDLFELLSNSNSRTKLENVKVTLERADVYFYCTLDDTTGRYRYPTFAILARGNNIIHVDVQTVLNKLGYKDNLDKDLINALEEKIKEFSNESKYKGTINKLRRVTDIYQKYIDNVEFSEDELRNLYKDIESTSHYYDPRVTSIYIDLDESDMAKDYAKIYNCPLSQIADYQSQITKDTKILVNSADYSELTSAEGLVLPEIIAFDLDLRKITSAEGLVMPKYIGNMLLLNSLTTAKGLILPDYIGGVLFLNSLTSPEGLVLPKKFNGVLHLTSLTNAKGLKFPERLERLFLNSLTNAEGLKLPEEIDIELDLSSLTNADYLVLPKYVGLKVNLSNLKSVKELVLPQFVGKELDLSNLESLDGLVFPEEFDYIIKTKFGIITKNNVSEYLNKNKTL